MLQTIINDLRAAKFVAWEHNDGIGFFAQDGEECAITADMRGNVTLLWENGGTTLLGTMREGVQAISDTLLGCLADTV